MMSRVCACLVAGCGVGLVVGVAVFFIAIELMDGRTEVRW